VSVKLILDLVVATAGALAMIRIGEKYRLIAKRNTRRCAACGRELSGRCRCRDVR
jgi:hypothetical protein